MNLSVEDQLELLALPARYGNAMDERNWAALRSIFTEDAVFDVRPKGLRMEGLEEIACMDSSETHPLSHQTMNAEISVHDERVSVRFRALLPLPNKDGSISPASAAFGFYYDEVVKTPAGWRVIHRLFTRAPRDMQPTRTDIARQHGLVKLLEMDRNAPSSARPGTAGR